MEAIQTTQDSGGHRVLLHSTHWGDTVTSPTLQNRIAWPRSTDTGEGRSLSSQGYDYVCPETSAGTSNVVSWPMAWLERCVVLDAKQVFDTIANSVDWGCHLPEELVRAVGLALQLNLVSLAMDMAQQGSRLFPQNVRIQNLAHALAPPRIRAVPASPTCGLDESRHWIREHVSEYRGKWVAVRNGELVGVAERLRDLSAVLDESSEATMVARVQ